jgi:hypothetical protein
MSRRDTPQDLVRRMADAGVRRKASDGFRRETFALPREEARAKARAFLARYPKAAYMTEIESWRELPDDGIEFTMRRLPTAD